MSKLQIGKLGNIALFPFVAALLVYVCGLLGCGGGGGDGNADVRGRVTTDGVNVSVLHSDDLTSRMSLFVKENFLIKNAFAQDATVALEGATVELFNDQGILIDSTTTNSNGEFFFIEVLPGNYRIVVSSPAIIVPLEIANVVVLSGDGAVVQGSVTEEGGVASVSYEVQDCGPSASVPAQVAHATQIAEAAGVSVEEVIAVRDGQCLGWGQVAAQFDVPQSTLGLGQNHSKGGIKGKNSKPNDDDDSKGNMGENEDKGNNGKNEGQGMGPKNS